MDLSYSVQTYGEQTFRQLGTELPTNLSVTESHSIEEAWCKPIERLQEVITPPNSCVVSLMRGQLLVDYSRFGCGVNTVFTVKTS